ncbi:hypothetical protein B0A52_02901 [Exophiala mesophila]|uniref:Alpha N-terminal protein methyltransferase 1 n=1 Tax=Exophiala mesophila TaxID=212818 RepID=A0A438NE63_EXOME|nr:hypothetical protein B0A52_02901 [Exophiala mesophila]
MDSDTSDPSAIDSQISTADQISYWQSISADVDGMLGGFPQVSRIDIQFSRNFIQKLRRLDNRSTRATSTLTLTPNTTQAKSQSPTNTHTDTTYIFQHALEPGAGIGRVTLNLLAPLCAHIDIVEPIEKFTAVLTAPESPLVKNHQLSRVWNLPLQDWSPTLPPAYTANNKNTTTTTSSPKYDLIFNQWCLNHLSFTSLVACFKSLIPLLLPTGWIVVKENLSSDAFGADIFDADDSSVTRSDANWRAAFTEAGLRLVKTDLQTGFPKELKLYPVRIYALRPVE